MRGAHEEGEEAREIDADQRPHRRRRRPRDLQHHQSAAGREDAQAFAEGDVEIGRVAEGVADGDEVEETLAKLGREPGGGLIVPPDAFTIVHDQLLVRLAQQHRVPAVYFLRTSVAQGALMSYGPDPYDNFRRSASYVDRILKGAKPADLPIQQPTKFELAINLKTAKTLGLEIPAALLARADEVIE